jgi:hypothetical protein
MECQRLNSDGKRCKRKAIYIEKYHGSPEIYWETKTRWCMVYLCGHHITKDLESENPPTKIREEIR